MAMVTKGNGRAGRLKVLECSVKCLGVNSAPVVGHRASLSLAVLLEGPNGERYRGVMARLPMRVYAVPVRGTGKARPKKPRTAKAKTKTKAPAASPSSANAAPAPDFPALLVVSSPEPS